MLAEVTRTLADSHRDRKSSRTKRSSSQSELAIDLDVVPADMRHCFFKPVIEGRNEQVLGSTKPSLPMLSPGRFIRQRQPASSLFVLISLFLEFDSENSSGPLNSGEFHCCIFKANPLRSEVFPSDLSNPSHMSHYPQVLPNWKRKGLCEEALQAIL
jgi:hypothetical protein